MAADQNAEVHRVEETTIFDRKRLRRGTSGLPTDISADKNVEVRRMEEETTVFDRKWLRRGISGLPADNSANRI